MCPSAPRECSEPGGQKPVLSLSLDLIGTTKLSVLSDVPYPAIPYHTTKFHAFSSCYFNLYLVISIMQYFVWKSCAMKNSFYQKGIQLKMFYTKIVKSFEHLNLSAHMSQRFFSTEYEPSDLWWRHQMEPFSALLALCAGNSPVSGEFPSQRPVARSFDVFFDLRLNKPLSKQSWGWWFETTSRSLWRHCNVGVCPCVSDWSIWLFHNTSWMVTMICTVDKAFSHTTNRIDRRCGDVKFTFLSARGKVVPQNARESERDIENAWFEKALKWGPWNWALDCYTVPSLVAVWLSTVYQKWPAMWLACLTINAYKSRTFWALWDIATFFWGHSQLGLRPMKSPDSRQIACR